VRAWEHDHADVWGCLERSAYLTNPEDVQLPVITIHSTGDVTRGKDRFIRPEDGSRHVRWNVCKLLFLTAQLSQELITYRLSPPAYVGPSGFGVIMVQTLPDLRASSIRQSYSVVVTLEPGPGYTVGQPSSARIMIKP
jgi:hypothetical protein